MGEHLKVACSTNNVELLQRSIQDVNFTDRHGVSAAYVAAESGHCDILHLLVDHGANLEIANQSGWSPIHVASQQGHSRVIRLLAERNVNLNLRSANRSGSSPIILACTNGHLNTLIVLLDSGANLDTKNSLGQGPVHICCMYGYDKCLMLLLDLGAEYTASDTNDFTPIEFAVMFGHADCVRHLMERGVKPNLEQLSPVLPAQKVGSLEGTNFNPNPNRKVITATEQSNHQSGKRTTAGGPSMQYSGLLCEGSLGVWFLSNHFLLLEKAPGRRLCQAQGNLSTVYPIEFPLFL